MQEGMEEIEPGGEILLLDSFSKFPDPLLPTDPLVLSRFLLLPPDLRIPLKSGNRCLGFLVDEPSLSSSLPVVILLRSLLLFLLSLKLRSRLEEDCEEGDCGVEETFGGERLVCLLLAA